MVNLKKWIEELLEGETIEAVVIGDFDWGDYKDSQAEKQKGKRNIVLSWEKAEPYLDYEFDSGYGSPECNCIYVWTNKSIMFVSQHDGATSLKKFPRNPVECKPEMPGG